MNIIVGMFDMKISNDPNAQIITYSLGSCIGIAIYDRKVRVGGILHFMLPDSSLNPDKAKKTPAFFADTGIPRLFRAAYELGAEKRRLKVIVAGGAQIIDQKGFFNIGLRNYEATKKLFLENKVSINYEDVGGTVSRTIQLAVKTGQTWIKSPKQQDVEI